MAEWFEDFFDRFYGEVLSQIDDSRTQDDARCIKRLLRLRKGHRVLDIPCGKGRVGLALAQRGLIMTGVDLSAPYLRWARRKAREAGLAVRFVRGDMRQIRFHGEFDAAFTWWGSLGYFSDDDNLKFCQRVRAALRSGGRFLVQGLNKTYLVSHLRARHESDFGEWHIVQRDRFDAKTSRLLSTLTRTMRAHTERRRICMKIYDGKTLRDLLGAAGFRGIPLYGRPPLGRFTRHSRRLIAVAQRPDR